MKRTIYSVTIFVALCLLLVACGPKAATQAPVAATQAPVAATQAPVAATQAPASAEKVTLEMWMFTYSEPYLAWLDTAIAKFKLTHPNVEVNVSPKNDDELETSLIASAASGDAPDVFINAIGFGAANVKAGLLHNIYDRWMAMPEAYRSQWSEATIAGVTPEPGVMYVMPYSGYGYILYRNLTVLRAAGIDPAVPVTTLDEWKAQMQKIQDSGATAIPNLTLDIAAIRIMYNSFSKQGEWGIDFKNNKSLINADAYVKTAEFLTSVKPFASVSTFRDQGIIDGWCADKIAFNIGGPWMNPTYSGCKAATDYDFTVIPGVSADRVSGVSGGEYISINTLGKNPDLAWEFVTFLNDWPQQLEAAEFSGQSTQNATAMGKVVNPVVKTVFKAISTGPVLFDTPPFFVEAYPDNYEQTITDNMNAIYEGKMTRSGCCSEIALGFG